MPKRQVDVYIRSGLGSLYQERIGMNPSAVFCSDKIAIVKADYVHEDFLMFCQWEGHTWQVRNNVDNLRFVNLLQEGVRSVPNQSGYCTVQVRSAGPFSMLHKIIYRKVIKHSKTGQAMYVWYDKKRVKCFFNAKHGGMCIYPEFQ